MSAKLLQALPKAELHLHLEGAMRPDTLTALCAKHKIDRPADTRGVRFENFGGFVATYMAACECLRDDDDIYRLVREVAEDAKASGALWIEVGLSMLLYHERYGGIKECLKLILRAAAAAETSTGIGIGLIVSAERQQEFFPMSMSSELARTVAELVESGEAEINGHAGIVGFGLHGDESNNPPEPFEACFQVACACCYKNNDTAMFGGFSSSGSADTGIEANAFRVAALPHAGELPPAPGKGADSVRYCVEKLGAKRIAHGVLAASDKDLVQLLVEKRVCLDVCPSSNYLLSVVAELSSTAHPLKELLSEGVICTINSDDPLLFGSSLLQEFELCRSQLQLTDTQLAQCAIASFEHSHAPLSIKQKGIEGAEGWLAAEGK